MSRVRLPRPVAALLAAGLGLSTGGFADSPTRVEGGNRAPTIELGGPTTVPLYTVSGVVDSATLATSFLCTNQGATNASVLVVVKEVDGSIDCNMSIPALAPGATATMSTSLTGAFIEDAVCALVGDSVRGSAIVAADSTGSIDLTCSVLLLDAVNTVPLMVDRLELYDERGTPASLLIFDDGFESNSTSRWSLTVP